MFIATLSSSLIAAVLEENAEKRSSTLCMTNCGNWAHTSGGLPKGAYMQAKWWCIG